MKVIYCHHAHRKKSNPPSQNDDITEIGEKDANIVSELLKELKTENNFNLKAIYTSEFFRCTKTTEIINTHTKLPVFIEPRLNEHKSIPNEEWVDTQNRVIEFLNELTSSYGDNDIVICVTSGVNIVPFICKQFNIPPSNNLPFINAPSCSPIIFNYK